MFYNTWLEQITCISALLGLGGGEGERGRERERELN
jgi:hypothetical protein